MRPPDIRPQKRDLRARMQTLRAAIPAAVALAAAEKLGAVFFAAYTPPSGSIVSAYYPVGDEINPLRLMLALHQRGYGLALPVMMGPQAPLQFRRYRPGQTLAINGIGIHEPDDTAAVLEPDIVLAPLLAFDAQKHRLGYGGGYYDRSLAQLQARKNIISIGLGYACQQVERVPTGLRDMPLSHILTEQFFL